MANSISKLAVMITGDTSGLARATGEGTRIVRRFNATVSQSSNLTGKSSLLQSLLIGGGGSPFLALATRGGPLALATLGLAAFAREGIKASANLEELRAQVRGLEGEINGLAEATNKPLSGWERLKQAAGDLASTLGGKQASQAGSTLSNSFADLFERMAATSPGSRFGSNDQSDIAKERTALQERLKGLQEQKRLADEAAAAEKRRQEEFRRAMDDARQRAESLAASLRSPSEEFAATIAELKGLFQIGLVSVETYQRGVKRAADELRAASKTATEFKRAGTITNAAAVEQNTAAAQSAIAAGRAELQRIADTAKEQLAVEKQQAKIQEETKRAIEKIKPVVFTKGQL